MYVSAEAGNDAGRPQFRVFVHATAQTVQHTPAHRAHGEAHSERQTGERRHRFDHGGIIDQVDVASCTALWNDADLYH